MATKLESAAGPVQTVQSVVKVGLRLKLVLPTLGTTVLSTTQVRNKLIILSNKISLAKYKITPTYFQIYNI